jgi:predicted dehydrogenase
VDSEIKVLFVGLGSIGQRHLRNYKTLSGETPFNLIAFRTSDQQSIIENGNGIKCESLAKHYGFVEFRSFDKALEQKPDVSFICNPSKLHIETAIQLTEIGSSIFIEKPLATDVTLLDKLERIIDSKELISMVGFQTRFHPCVKEVKRILKEKQFGSIISAQFDWSTYLPDHHPYEDYRKGYAARNDLGGGVVFSLSHELDLIQHFFGLPISVYGVTGGKSRLEMDVEDTVSGLFRCESEKRIFPVSFHLSFVQGVEKRSLAILFEDAYLECDLSNNKLRVLDHQQKIIHKQDINTLNRNDLFMEEMRQFLDCVTNECQTDIPVSEGKKSLLMALAIHKSIQTGNVESFA